MLYLRKQIQQCGSSSVGRALASQAEGRGFESRLPLIKEVMAPLQWWPLVFLCKTRTRDPLTRSAMRKQRGFESRLPLIKK